MRYLSGYPATRILAGSILCILFGLTPVCNLKASNNPLLEPHGIPSFQTTGNKESTVIEPELKPFIQKAVADLAKRLEVDAASIEVVHAERVVWPDASLGCPQPGMAYTQVQQDGYVIRLAQEEQLYSYHGGGRRGPFLCEKKTDFPRLKPKPD